MRDSSFRISLDIHEVQSQVSLPVKTGDTARKILINLTENGAPYPIDNNCIAIFSAIKSDGKKIINDCIIEANRIRYDITAQTVSAEGIVNAEIILYGEDEAVICSPRFDLVVDDRVIGVTTLSEDEKNVFDSYALAEIERNKNEAKRIEAYNNIDIDVIDGADYVTVKKTNKNGSQEEVVIAKGKNSVSPEHIVYSLSKDVKDSTVPSSKAVVDFAGITNTAKGNSFAIASSNAPLRNLKLYGAESGNSKINLFKKNIFDIGTDVSGYFSSNTNGSKIITSVGTVSKNIDLSFSNDSILVNNYNVTGYYWLSKFVELTPNTDYTLSASNNMGGVRIYGADSNAANTVGTQIGNMYDNYTEVTFNSGEYKYYWISFFPKEAGQKLEKCQLEVGIKATEYESFEGKQALTFTDTLYRVGDIKDEKDYSKGIKIQRVKAVTISSLGTLSVVALANGGKGLVVTPADKKSAISGAVCTNAEYERGSLSYLDGTFYENKLNFVFCGTSSDTLETLTAKYGSAVLTYVIATEVETSIPEAELSAYRQLHTYEGITTIVSNGEVEVEFFVGNQNGQVVGGLQSQIKNDVAILSQEIELLKNYVTPQMFGAVGDGVTDDTEAFQKLDGKSVFIPEGTYIVSKCVYGPNTCIRGAGKHKTIIKQKEGTNSDMLVFKNARGGMLCDVGLQGVKTDTHTSEYDALLKIVQTKDHQGNSFFTKFHGIAIQHASCVGLMLVGHDTKDPNYINESTYNWVHHIDDITIMHCGTWNMIDESCDNRFSNFYIAGGKKGGLLIYRASSNMYVNFKIDGDGASIGKLEGYDDGALLLLDICSNLRFVNFDLQTGDLVGMKIKTSKGLRFDGDMNNMGWLLEDGGICLMMKETTESEFNVEFHHSNKKQKCNVLIEEDCENVSVWANDRTRTENINKAPHTCFIVNTAETFAKNFSHTISKNITIDNLIKDPCFENPNNSETWAGNYSSGVTKDENSKVAGIYSAKFNSTVTGLQQAVYKLYNLENDNLYIVACVVNMETFDSSNSNTPDPYFSLVNNPSNNTLKKVYSKLFGDGEGNKRVLMNVVQTVDPSLYVRLYSYQNNSVFYAGNFMCCKVSDLTGANIIDKNKFDMIYNYLVDNMDELYRNIQIEYNFSDAMILLEKLLSQ
jgi:hypothetical protein